MKNDRQLIAVVLLIGVGLYLYMRQKAGGAGMVGDVAALSNTGTVNRASTAGGATGIGTNPLTLAFQSLERGLTSLLGSSRPGRAPAVAAQPSSPQTSVRGPSLYAGSLVSPPLTPVPTGTAYPALQDPNLGYLTNLSDLSTLLTPGVYISDMSGANQAGELGVSSDFDWQYSPTTPGISIVGID